MEAGLTVAVGGEYGRLSMSGSGGRGGGQRGPIRGFSRGSRRRLLDLINQIDRRLISLNSLLFLTLTYPGEFSTDWRVWKADLRALIMRLQRRYPGIMLIWRLEFQRRGAPHFHILVLNVERIDKDWLSTAWYEIVGSGDLRHFQAGTQVSRVKSWRGVLFYVGKYLAKRDETKWCTGRIWGVVGRLPITLVFISVSAREFYQIRRILRRWLSRRLGRRVWWASARGGGIKVYLPAAVLVALVMSI